MAQETTVAVKINAQIGGTESVKTLKQQITEATNEATRLADEFGKFSPQAIEAAKKAADLKQQMGDVQKNIAAIGANKFEKIAGVVGGMARGIQSAQGAMALFGSESEDLQKTLLKVQGAMAFAEGISGIMALQATFATLFTSVIAGFRAMAAAITSTGVGALIVVIGVAIAGLINYLNEESEATKKAKEKNEELKQSLEDLNERYSKLISTQEDYAAYVLSNMEKEGKSEQELYNTKKMFAQQKIDILENQRKEEEKNYNEQIKNLAKEGLSQVEYNKKYKQLQKDKLEAWMDAGDKITSASYALQRLENEQIKAQKEAAKKAQEEANQRWKEYQNQLKSQADAERGALQSLNEEKRKLREQDTKDAIELEKIKLQNDLERLIEQRANALRAENLTKKAIADINAKFDLSEQIARQNSAKTIAAIEKERTAKEKADLEERKAAHEKFIEDAKALTQKEISDAVAATDKLYATKKNQLILQGATQAEFDNLEIQRLEAQLQNAKDYGELTKDETLRIEAELFAKKKEIRDKEAAEIKAAHDAQIELAKQGFSTIVQLADAFAGKSEAQQKKAFEIKKIASIAQTLIETYQAAQSAYASQMTIPTPDAPVRAAVAAGLAIASGLARVASIKKTKFEGGGGGAGAGGNNTPNAPQTTPLTGGTLPDTEAGQFAGMGKVYVLEGDITKTQTRVRRVRNVSVV